MRDNLLNFESWAVITTDSSGWVRALNEKANYYFPAAVVGREITETFPWFRKEWLSNKVTARVVKTSGYNKVLMEVVADQDHDGELHFIFKNINEYHNVAHLWCEIENSLIPLQPFIDNFHDGILIANGEGIVQSVNAAFCLFSGIQEDDLLGKSLYELSKKGLIPDCPMMQVLKSKRSESAFVKFPYGKETVVSCKPVCDQHGNTIRVLSNVCDITEIKKLHEKLRSAEAIAEHYQRELHAKDSADWQSLGIFRSRAMEELYDLVKKVANTELPLLMMGESGVGKTALAKYMYNLSQLQQGGNFVHINCSSIPETLLESELFGYEPGAFTGANKAKVGLFEIARDGMILLDEIGDMPLILQAKLLNVLQEKKFYRIGGTKIIRTNARVIAATNQNLEYLIAEGRFRRDLYFRLNVIPITIPPLRDRKEDIAPLIVHLLEESNKRHKRSKILATSTLTILLSYEWPGNIRELMNMIERLVVLTNEDTIEPHHLPPELTCLKIMNQSSRSCSELLNNMSSKSLEPLWKPGQPLKLAINQIEGRIIDQAIDLYGSVKLAAKKLAVDESTLTRKRNRMNNSSEYKLHVQK